MSRILSRRLDGLRTGLPGARMPTDEAERIQACAGPVPAPRCPKPPPWAQDPEYIRAQARVDRCLATDEGDLGAATEHLRRVQKSLLAHYRAGALAIVARARRVA